jgi:hypothetical protein
MTVRAVPRMGESTDKHGQRPCLSAWPGTGQAIGAGARLPPSVYLSWAWP